MSGDPWNWQHTRSRIGRLRFHDEQGEENVHRLSRVNEDAFDMIGAMFENMRLGRVAAIGMVAVLTDRSTVTAFDNGTGSIADLIGATEMLKSRIILRIS